jgi:5-methyltetrahydrofolate--homocysteine methyltransferase
MNFPLILDGATGTGLSARGMPRGVCPEAWILDNPGALLDIQQGYLAAGSQALLAPTFGVSRRKLAAYGLEDKVGEFCERLVALTREAAGGKALAGGDLTQSGVFLAPMGDASMDDLIAHYLCPAKALAAAGVDFFLFETLMSLADARAAFLAVRQVSDKPILVSFTVDEHGRTLSGGRFPALLAVLQSMGAAAVGLNCSTGPDRMLPVLRQATPYAAVPLLAKPNAGLPRVEGGHSYFDMEPDAFAAHAQDLWDAGVRVFGGCCGTDAGHIKALVDAVGAASCRPLCATEDRGRTGASAPAQYLATEREVFPPDAIPQVISIRSQEDIDTLAEEQMYLEEPVCLRGDDPALLKTALAAYQGRAMLDCPNPVDFPGVLLCR